jgi:hypothetical protein
MKRKSVAESSTVIFRNQNGRGIMQNRRVAIIDGFRTPFTRAFTDFAEMTAIDLAKVVLSELVNRSEIDPTEIDEIAMGVSIPKLFPKPSTPTTCSLRVPAAFLPPPMLP